MSFALRGFSKGYFLVEGVDVVPFNFQEGEGPVCDPYLYDDLSVMLGEPVRARVYGPTFTLKPADWVPMDTVVVPRSESSSDENPAVLVERGHLRL